MVSFDMVSFDTDAHPKEKQMTIDMIMNAFIFAFIRSPHWSPTKTYCHLKIMSSISFPSRIPGSSEGEDLRRSWAKKSGSVDCWALTLIYFCTLPISVSPHLATYLLRRVHLFHQIPSIGLFNLKIPASKANPLLLLSSMSDTISTSVPSFFLIRVLTRARPLH